MAAATLVALLSCAAVLLQASAQEGTVAKTLSLGTVKLQLLAPNGAKVISTEGAHPSQLLASPQISAQHSLEVKLSVTAGGEDFKPQQVFLSLQHVATGAAAYAVGKAKKGSGYTITAPLSIITSQVGNQAGEYIAWLLVGDPSVSNSIQWELGKVELVLEAGQEPSTAQRTARMQPVNSIKPTISHVFRRAEKQPPAVVSLAFAALAFVPLVGLLGYLFVVVGVNFKAWPRDGTTSVFALAFHGLLGAVLFVYMLFWTKWNLAETLPVVLLLGIATAYVGHKALSGIATERFSAKKD